MIRALQFTPELRVNAREYEGFPLLVSDCKFEIFYRAGQACKIGEDVCVQPREAGSDQGTPDLTSAFVYDELAAYACVEKISAND